MELRPRRCAAGGATRTRAGRSRTTRTRRGSRSSSTAASRDWSSTRKRTTRATATPASTSSSTPALHNRGLGAEAVRRVVALLRERGHHRITIDPAADNAAAIRCYEKAGFRPVGVLRQYERDVDGKEWHDGLLMELLPTDG